MILSMRYLPAITLVLLIGLCISCIKDPVKIQIFGPHPEKFECYINGQDFVPDQGIPNLMGEGGPVMVYLKKLGDRTYDMDISTRITSSNGSPARDLDLFLHQVSGPGTFEFNGPQKQYAEYGIYPIGSYNVPPVNVIYRDDSVGNGEVVLSSFDIQKSIIAGTFSFNAVNTQNLADSVKVTAGHFNINFSDQ